MTAIPSKPQGRRGAGALARGDPPWVHGAFLGKEQLALAPMSGSLWALSVILLNSVVYILVFQINV